MSSYTLSGDDVLFGGKNVFQKIGKALVKVSPLAATIKFVANPVKETKAAVKTVARFDPTSKTAKYGNVTKGALIGAAAVGATVLTLGAAAGVGAIAAGAAGGIMAGAKLAATPVRRPVTGNTPTIIPGVDSMGAPTSNTLVDSTGYTQGSPENQPAPQLQNDTSATDAATTKKSSMVVIACVAASIGVLLLTMKKPSRQAA
jgi:hypothetical protein